MPSIVKKIEETESHRQTCERRLDVIERKLRLGTMPDSKREDLEKEEKILQATLDKHKKDLTTLRFENFKTMLVSVVLLFFIYGIFYLYTSNQGGSTIQTRDSHGS